MSERGARTDRPLLIRRTRGGIGRQTNGIWLISDVWCSVCVIVDTEHRLSKFWPAQVHVIGKDIIWFHCVIWPCILMSAGVPLPER